jgi:PKD repeat protein
MMSIGRGGGVLACVVASVMGLTVLVFLLARSEAAANHPPVITFGPSFVPTALVPTGQPGEAVVQRYSLVTFNAAANDADGDPLSYHWSFGDGINSTGSTVTHRYGLRGTYTATVTVSDGSGTATASRTISVMETGGIDAPVPLPNWSLGPKSVLFIRVNFIDNRAADPVNPTLAAATADSLSRWVRQVSYGKASFSQIAITPLLTLRFAPTHYTGMGTFGGIANLIADARNLARASGYDTDRYDLDCVFIPTDLFSQSLAYNACKGALIPGTFGLYHEFGHTFGLHHAGLWKTFGGDMIGPGVDQNYGHPFDLMGSLATTGKGEPLCASQKNRLHWLPDANVSTVTSSGIYRIFRVDASSLEPTGRYALKIEKDVRDYWVEFLPQFNSALMNGVLLSWSPWSSSQLRHSLLAAAPGSYVLTLGSTFTDAAAGIQITPVAKAGTIPESIDVMVKLSPERPVPPGAPPTLSDIADTIIDEDTRSVALPFAIGDPDTPASRLMLLQSTSDQTLVPARSISFGGNGASRTVSLIPSLHQTGTLRLRVAVSDGYHSSSKSFSVTVRPVNDAPFAYGQSSVTVAPETAQRITLTATDVEGDPLTYRVVTGPSHGVLAGVPPHLTYQPAPGFHGSDHFTFHANDGIAESNIAPVTLTVTDRPPTLPTAPSNLAAVAAGSVVHLSWNDHSSDETGFKVERRTGETGAFSLVGTVGTNMIFFRDSELSGNTAYYYRVQATNTAGSSAFSNEAEAKTP